MTTLTVRIDDGLAEILEKFCKEEDRSKSWFMKKFLKEGLEERMDYKAAIQALEEHEASGSKTHSIESVAQEFGVTLKKTKKS